MKRPLRFILVGPGAVGSALASALRRQGHRQVACYGRMGRLGRASPSGEPFDLLLIAVPDRSIAEVARFWAQRPDWRGRFALHTSGAVASTALAPLGRRGAWIGSLHPLASLPRGRRDPRALRGVSFGIEGHPAARRLAQRLVRELGGWPLILRGRSRAAYHLGACLASGYLLALVSIAAELLARGGSLRGNKARDAVLELALSSLRNAKSEGLEKALTGPLARGDLATVAKHLAALRQAPGDWRAVHRILAGQAAGLLERSGRITRRDRAAVIRLLRRGG